MTIFQENLGIIRNNILPMTDEDLLELLELVNDLKLKELFEEPSTYEDELEDE